MFKRGRCVRLIVILSLSMGTVCLSYTGAFAQTNLKKIRMGIAATSVGFLPIYTAYHRGFYKDEGIDLEIILMSLAAANNASSRARSTTARGSPAWPSPPRETTRRRF